MGPRGREKTPPINHSGLQVFDLSTAHWVSRVSSLWSMRKNGDAAARVQAREPTLRTKCRASNINFQANDYPPEKHKKTPLRYACLDEFQVWQTEGARSRNHKKMGCQAKLLHTDHSVCYGPLDAHLLDRTQYRASLPFSIGSIGYHFSGSPLNLYDNSVYYPVDNFIFRTYDT